MRVLHAVPGLAPRSGGPSRSVPELCTALKELGIEITLVALARPNAPERFTPAAKRLGTNWFEPLLGVQDFPGGTFLRWLSREVKSYDLVHIHSVWSPFVTAAAAAARRAGVPFLISPRGMLHRVALTHHRLRKTVYRRLVDRETLSNCRSFHFLSLSEREESEQAITHCNARRVVIPSGVDPNLGSSIKPGAFRSRYPLLGDDPFVLSLGRLHWTKDLDLQVKAFERIAREEPDFRWVLAGPDSGEYERVREGLRAAGLERRHIWVGTLSDEVCLEALRDASAFWLTSRHEAHSFAMNQALAMQAPVVITESVGFALLAEYGAGLVARNDPEAVADAVLRVIRDDGLRGRAQRGARDLLHERLSWPAIAREMEREYVALLETASWAASPC
ncbi:MAG: glycosyltransferase [Thermoanaerobaculia bacterium]|nr:glycosyltransferase [Thermoanaerobaculia bacterium]